MHETQTIFTDVGGVCLSVCLSVTRLKSAAARAVCAGSLGAAFVKVGYDTCQCSNTRIFQVYIFHLYQASGDEAPISPLGLSPTRPPDPLLVLLIANSSLHPHIHRVSATNNQLNSVKSEPSFKIR